MTVCYRHPDRATALRCTRCDRYICADCMRTAAVGQHCVDCAQAGAASVRRARPVVRAASGVPVVTYALIALSVLAFGAQVSSHQLESDLVLWTPAVAHGQVYRLLTSAFLHYGLPHLLLNMWALYVVGPQLEGLLGRVRFSALYFLSALGGSVAVYLLAPITAATAGASGAIFGLFGATLVVGRRLRMDVRAIGAVIVVNLIFTFTIPNISWQGHLGGLITGSLVAWAYVYPGPAARDRIQLAVSLGLLALFIALIWWRTAELVS
ncbi:rhomboid family intramembrane serine protease [[Mycobacterium] kokjensenii]|uniref:Rhomboid family intramembrane serine protease n=1 Tax=[Mycobacterium] kokjensenii TaxID=3064287 RepID=A0ABM9LWP9_9MYCO|nr:rhomboid family intramembrane serine protease [Mycolicibacter sp. MU0083]CAJ1505993.1 rhomboid family intramembrane serine protease [Mycolicibacter sp. MU0083]